MELAKRKSIRLREYDYASNGAYFITICTKGRACVLGTVVVQHLQICTDSRGCVGNGLDRSVSVQLTSYGEIVKNELENVSCHFPFVRIDKYVVMPNHIHAIVMIENPVEQAERSRPFPTMSTIIGLFKSGVSRKIATPIWQKSFHDHIIRTEHDYQEIWQYIDTNPLKWAEDCYYTP